MSSILKVDQLKDSGGNAIITSNGSGTFTSSLPNTGITQADVWRYTASTQQPSGLLSSNFENIESLSWINFPVWGYIYNEAENFPYTSSTYFWIPLNPLKITTKDAALTNNPNKDIREIRLIIFLDFLANKYLLEIKLETFIVTKLTITI